MQALRKQQAASGRTCGQNPRPFVVSQLPCRRSTQQRHVQCSISRREGLASIALAPVLLSAGAAVAEPVAGQTLQYVDPTDSFQLTLPANWQQAEAMIEGNKSYQGASGARRTIAWYPADGPADETNVTLTITNTSAEFTKLGSFGNVFAFGTNLVNSMDRSFLLRVRGNNPNPDEPIQIAKLLDAAESRGMYYVEYSVEKQPGPKRHLYSMVALAYNGRYNRLYTLTAQCLEDQVETAEPVLKAVLKSFLPPAGVA
uniref:PsbP C-terminal domain-containing protein n=1 Tax=Tetradesmus obliquus TaxID=3088 RepID=A0A383WAY8_TETOB|eukprot:jgi/Sobl393_1/39/SZX74778.1